MDISEKVAYLKGLAEGMQLSKDTNEGKMIHAIIEVLDEVSQAVDVLEFDIDVLDSQISDMDTDCDCDCDDYDDYEGEIYEVVCPQCEETIFLDEDDLDEGELICYNCGEKLELDFSDDSEYNEQD